MQKQILQVPRFIENAIHSLGERIHLGRGFPSLEVFFDDFVSEIENVRERLLGSLETIIGQLETDGAPIKEQYLEEMRRAGREIITDFKKRIDGEGDRLSREVLESLNKVTDEVVRRYADRLSTELVEMKNTAIKEYHEIHRSCIYCGRRVLTDAKYCDKCGRILG